jgi:hypothetical protein
VTISRVKVTEALAMGAAPAGGMNRHERTKRRRKNAKTVLMPGPAPSGHIS